MVILSRLRPAEPIQTLCCCLFSCLSFLAALFVFAPLALSSQTTLTWNSSSDPEVVGYRLYYGNASRDYFPAMDVDSQTSWTITDLIEGTPYYFAVTAYDQAGNESDFSEEVSQTIYEDAEDISTAGWDLCPLSTMGGVITNVFDSNRQGNVITLRGYGLYSCFRLRRADFTDWNNANQFVIAWSQKCSSLFRVAVVVETSTVTLQLSYSPVDYDRLAMRDYIDFGIGSNAINGSWHTFTRNLQTDLNKALPGVTIVKVKYFTFRGSCKVTDIKLMHSP
jgi:hypothetical protein